jgi:ribosomal protein S18 acetylase RimI-like enzyme
MPDLAFRRAFPEDEPRLQAIRRAAFAPVFASFRSLLGDELYDLAQRREDEAQEAMLSSLLAPDSVWELYVAESGGEIAGFVSVQLNHETGVGEIGLNAVDPPRGSAGIGTAMYELVVRRMVESGMKVAMVATGGDSSHEPARRAYRKAGFDKAIPSVWMVRKL